MSWLTNICYYENNHSHVCYDSLDLRCEQEGQCNMVTIHLLQNVVEDQNLQSLPAAPISSQKSGQNPAFPV